MHRVNVGLCFLKTCSGTHCRPLKTLEALTYRDLLLGPRKKFDRLLETRREMDLPSPMKCRSITRRGREYISLMFLFYAIIFAVSFFFYNGAKFFLFKSFFDLISYRIQHASIRSNRPKASMKRSFDLF